LNNEVRDILRPHMTEEERKQDDEFREAIRNARTEEERLEIQRRYSRFRQQLIDQYRQSDDPEKRKAADQAQPGLDEIKKREEELERRLQRRTENERIRSESTDTTHNGPTSGGRLIIASSEANVASLGDLPNGTNATSVRGPSGGPLERV
jgi:hypothetical protein